MWLTRSLAAGPGAAGLSGAPHSSAQPPGVARGLGSCARAPPPADAAPERACELAELERCGLTKRQDSGRRVAGARGSEPADQLSRRPRHRSLSNSDAGTRAGPQGTCPTEPRAPTWRTWDLPAATWGLAGQGLGLSPRAPLSPRRQGGRGETPHHHSIQPEPGLLLGALFPVFLPRGSGHRLWECRLRTEGSPFFGEGY